MQEAMVFWVLWTAASWVSQVVSTVLIHLPIKTGVAGALTSAEQVTTKGISNLLNIWQIFRFEFSQIYLDFGMKEYRTQVNNIIDGNQAKKKGARAQLMRYAIFSSISSAVTLLCHIPFVMSHINGVFFWVLIKMGFLFGRREP
jgi:hypothetical protein